MSHLKSLTIIEAPKKNTFNAVAHRRKKMIDKIDEQIAIHEAEAKGEIFQRTRSVWITDDEGVRKKIDKPVYPKQWWWIADDGKALLEIKYGTKPLMLQKDKTAIEVGEISNLPKALDSVRTAILSGELDAAIEQVAQRPKAGKQQAQRKQVAS